MLGVARQHSEGEFFATENVEGVAREKCPESRTFVTLAAGFWPGGRPRGVWTCLIGRGMLAVLGVSPGSPAG